MLYVRNKVEEDVTINNFATIAKKYGINLNVKIPYHVFYMIYELGKEDLWHWIHMHYNRDDMIIYFSQVLHGIYDMNDEGIIHNDLHLGNIILVNRNCGLVAAIHDFGESKMTDFETDSDYYKDYIAFLFSLSSALKEIDKIVYKRIVEMEANWKSDFEEVDDKSTFMLYILDKYFD